MSLPEIMPVYNEEISANAGSHLFERGTAILILSLLLAYLAGATLYRSSRKFFWYDEVLTVAVTNQHSFSGIWNALEHAADGNPPPFYAVEGFFSRLFSDEHVGYRIPSIVGFLCVPAALFWFVKRRAGNLLGLIAAIPVLFTSLYSTYSIEARPYALIVGLVAIALVVWQRCDKPQNAWILAIMLASATSLHFYAVFALFPFAVGEITRTARLRQWRFHVWTALGAAFIPLIVFFPLLWAHKQHLGTHFWAKLSVFSGPGLYTDLFDPPSKWGAVLVLAAILIGTAALIGDLLQWDTKEHHAFPIEEHVCMLGFLALPLVGYLACRVAGQGMVSRYTLPAVLGVCLAVAVLVHRARQSVSIALVGIILCCFIFQEARYWISHGGDPKAEATAPTDNRVVAELLAHTEIHALPVVVSDGLRYLPMAYYASLRKQGEFWYVTDPAKAVQYAKSDSLDRGLAIVSAYLPVNVRRFLDFSRQHSQFFLYSTGDVFWDWWPRRLRDDGYLIRPVAARLGRTLYFVDLRHKAISSGGSSP